MESDVLSYFIRLVKIDSESRNERAIADALIQDLRELGAEVTEDRCCESTTGNAGNLIARIPGSVTSHLSSLRTHRHCGAGNRRKTPDRGWKSCFRWHNSPGRGR
jgi:di/tripeptidase